MGAGRVRDPVGRVEASEIQKIWRGHMPGHCYKGLDAAFWICGERSIERSVQGSIVVHSDKLVVYFVDGDAEKLVFTGNKAKFKQTPNVGAKDITGESFIGHYFPKINQLVLIDTATVWKDDGIYASDLIEYNTKTSLVNAGEKSTDTKRVHVILKPKSKEQPIKKSANQW